MEFLNNKAMAEICGFIKANYRRIEVIPGKCRYNYKCHLNSVHEAIRKGHDRIVMCIYIDNGTPIIHFLNVSKTGKFKDNTLGEWSQLNDHYFIKYIDKEDFFNTGTIFTSYRKFIRTQLSFFVRMLSDWEC